MPQLSGPDDPQLAAWYQTIELGDGLASHGYFDHRPVADRYGLPASLTGLSALDVGTAEGFWAFEMERRGAGPVTAVDIPSLAHADLLAGARERMDPAVLADTGLARRFALAKERRGSAAERIEMSVYELSPERLGTFDVVFCGDLLLHLQNPLEALLAIHSVTRRLAVIETVREHELEAAHPDRPFMQFGVLDAEQHPGQNITYWKFTTRALCDMLRYAGFSRVEPQAHFALPPHDLPATAVVAYV